MVASRRNYCHASKFEAAAKKAKRQRSWNIISKRAPELNAPGRFFFCHHYLKFGASFKSSGGGASICGISILTLLGSIVDPAPL